MLVIFPFGLVALVPTPFLVVSIDRDYPYGLVALVLTLLLVVSLCSSYSYGKVAIVPIFSSSFSSLV